MDNWNICERTEKNGFCLVAETDGCPDGAYLRIRYAGTQQDNPGGYLGFSEEELMSTAVFDSAKVKEKYRGKGLLKRLIEEAVGIIRENGFCHMLAKVHPDNRAALKSFLARGFVLMSRVHERGTESLILYRSFCGAEYKEYFRLFDDSGEPIEKIKERSAVHRDGDIHGGAHIWIAEREGERLRILLQKRSTDKDSFPGCYDCSSAGHVDAGEEFASTAQRELLEELGIEADEEELVYLFKQKVGGEYVFRGETFKNREINYVYLLNKHIDIRDIVFQKTEIQSVEWQYADEIMERLEHEDDRYCIWKDEFKKVLEITCNFTKAILQ